ncbi:SDR family oxidoreductase [Croceitalea rosinachiae]|uniref:SDR family oxidoreductase n=1 Tax=Croceitalea rosinachiae TaxID=3075596 RepID=A0ABU3AEQ8_9FLAO|nr:SDR family oxidoreductase [Croceitalea sp. F388]MDT0607366.1 SDR family oxidoreductase [Croceitalea sp. F388]
MDKLKDKVIWVTGASSGIGKELAYQLSKRNCKLILSARRKEVLEKVKNQCSNPKDVKILPLDIIEFEKADSYVEIAIDLFGKVDIQINNAGVSQRSLIAETDFSVYKTIMDIDYLGTVALSKAILPHFMLNNAGHYVVVSSLMGKFSSPYRSGYCGAKHALHGFFDAMRMEHEKHGVRVTMVCPGFVNTNIAKSALTGDGTLQESNDSATQNGLSTTNFCNKMITAIKKEKFEVYIGGKEVKGVFIKRFFPKLLHKLVLKSQVR